MSRPSESHRSASVGAAGAQCCRSGLEPQQTIARVGVAQLRQHPQGVVPALLAVVQEDEGEAGLGAHGARTRRGLFHHTQSLCAVAIEAGHVGDHPRRQVHAGHNIPVSTEDQARIGIVWCEGAGLFGCLVRASRRAERGPHPTFHGS